MTKKDKDREGSGTMSRKPADGRRGFGSESKLLNSEVRIPQSERSMQIGITGRGGQGVLFLTRILGECAMELGLDVITSETHGMAMRGGSVVSTLKIGNYRGPLIGSGQAQVMVVLDEGSMDAFTHLLSEKGTLLLNAPSSTSHPCIDATGLAAALGNPVVANLVLLGFAFRHDVLFCDYALVESVTEKLSPPRFREINLKALRMGFSGPAEKELK
jgi:indolepyruvate ferredoxin oxidoreductase, beta subunit